MIYLAIYLRLFNNMQEKIIEKIDKRVVLLGLIVIVLLVGLYFVIKNSGDEKISKDGTNQISTTTDTTLNSTTTKIVDLGNGIVAVGKGDFKIQQITDNSTINFPKPLPDLNRKVVFSTNVNEEVKSLILSKIEDSKNILKENPTSLSSWLDLGIYHKMAGDINGAIIYFDYAGKLAPSTFMPFANLADLYGYYVKDFPKAETNFNLAIANSKDQSFSYFKFAEFYRDVLNDKQKALEVVERGLKAIPNNKELLALKESLK